MKRLKKSIYKKVCCGVLLVLALVRWTCPSIVEHRNADCDSVRIALNADSLVLLEPVTLADEEDSEMAETVSLAPTVLADEKVESAESPVEVEKPKSAARTARKWHPLGSVHSYKACFPDVQETQIVAAKRWGVKPVKDREMAEERKSELVYVASSPYYVVDPAMRSSIPYLVPRASELLQRIGKNFLDSLYVRGIPMHKIIVSSVLRTTEDVKKLQKSNTNAVGQSCHCFGTTVDIRYTHFHTVSPPDEPRRREVRDDTLKWVLSQVLRDLRKEGACYVKYEVKQACFHLTVR